MARRIKLSEHLSSDALEQRYRQATDGIERSHYQIVWLLHSGKKAYEVAEVTGYSTRWIGEIAHRYNEGGLEALGDQRHQNPGGQWLLSEGLQTELKAVLAEPPADGGLWNSRKVAEWISSKLQRKVYPQRGWDYLRVLGLTPQVPRPHHAKADALAQEQFKKKISRRL